jgi:hypothetical protein
VCVKASASVTVNAVAGATENSDIAPTAASAKTDLTDFNNDVPFEGDFVM